MKRYFELLLAFLILSLILIGCKEGINYKTSNKMANPTSEISNNEKIKNNKLNLKNEQKNNNEYVIIDNKSIQKNEIFFGKWIVDRVIISGKLRKRNKNNIQNILGKRLVYSLNEARFDDKICSNPTYKKSKIINEAISDNNVTFNDLGITSKYAILVEVLTNNTGEDLWLSSGNLFLVKNSNTLILIDRGVFFEVKRVKF